MDQCLRAASLAILWIWEPSRKSTVGSALEFRQCVIAKLTFALFCVLFQCSPYTAYAFAAWHCIVETFFAIFPLRPVDQYQNDGRGYLSRTLSNSMSMRPFSRSFAKSSSCKSLCFKCVLHQPVKAYSLEFWRQLSTLMRTRFWDTTQPAMLSPE